MVFFNTNKRTSILGEDGWVRLKHSDQGEQNVACLNRFAKLPLMGGLAFVLEEKEVFHGDRKNQNPAIRLLLFNHFIKFSSCPRSGTFRSELS